MTNIERQFETPLGVVRCGLNCAHYDTSVETKEYKNGHSEIYKTAGHKVEIISFKIRVPLYNGDNLTDSLGWIFRIEKNSDTHESLETYCLLDKKTDDIEFDIATGEHLDAIEAYNQDWTLHIGTEDGEVLYSRAENDDWFPTRLKNKVESYQSITVMKRNGFTTRIPDLAKDEKVHIQYLIAYDKRDMEKVNTWLAVDEFKEKLEYWIGI